MNKYFRRISNNSIVVSLDLSTFSSRDIDTLVENNREFRTILDRYNRNKTYSITYTKKHIIEILGENVEKKHRIELIFKECDNDRNTVCTELCLTNGRFLELCFGNSNVIHLEDWDYSDVLYRLGINILQVKVSSNITKMSGDYFKSTTA